MRPARPPALLLVLLGSAAPAFAQRPPTAADRRRAAAGRDRRAAAPGARSYTPADFARFAPRNALDMLNNVPGFAIDESDTERRGLGQATGNVLINGERFSGKSTDIFTELRRISAANVTRIEIVDGATLNISGLTGQVANIITALAGPVRQFRLAAADPRAAHAGAAAQRRDLDQRLARRHPVSRLSFRNDSFRNGNAGPELRDHSGRRRSSTVRDEVLYVDGEQPRLTRHDPPQFRRRLDPQRQRRLRPLSISTSTRSRCAPGPGQPDRDRFLTSSEREYNYELGGDYEFGLGGGRLKLIGLRRFEHSPYQPDPDPDLRRRPPDPGPALHPGRRRDRDDRCAANIAGAAAAPTGRSASKARSTGSTSRTACSSSTRPAISCPCPSPTARRPSRRRRAEAMLTYGRPLVADPDPAGLGRRRIFEAQPDRRRRPHPHLLPAQGLRQPRLAAARRARHQRPDRARRRPAQLLRFRRLGQRQRRHDQCRQRQSGAAAKLERANPGDPQPRPLGHRHRAALRAADHRHRRRHPDRRERPVAGQSARAPPASTACNGPARSTSIRSAGAAPSST